MNFLGTECPQCNSDCWLQNKIERLDSLSSQPASLTAILSFTADVSPKSHWKKARRTSNEAPIQGILKGEVSLYH